MSNGDVRGARGTVFQEIRPGAGFKTGDFVKRKVGGATVERLYFKTTAFFFFFVPVRYRVTRASMIVRMVCMVCMVCMYGMYGMCVWYACMVCMVCMYGMYGMYGINGMYVWYVCMVCMVCMV